MRILVFSLLISFFSWGDETSALYEAPTKSKKKEIQTKYEACKDVDLSSLSFSEEKDSKKKTIWMGFIHLNRKKQAFIPSLLPPNQNLIIY